MDIFQALADPTRRHIIERLSRYDAAKSGLSIKELTTGFSISRQAVTKHLNTLIKCGVVKADFVGKEKRHFLLNYKFVEAWQWLEPIATQWDEKLSSLDKHLKSRN